MIEDSIECLIPELLEFMIEQGADTKNTKLKDGVAQSALAIGFECKNFKAVQILERVYNLSDPIMPTPTQAPFVNTVLTIGILKNSSETALSYLDPNTRVIVAMKLEDILGYSDCCLFRAVHHKDLDLLQSLIDRFGMTLDSPDAYFAAIHALQTSSLEILQFFESRGLKLDNKYDGILISPILKI